LEGAISKDRQRRKIAGIGFVGQALLASSSSLGFSSRGSKKKKKKVKSALAWLPFHSLLFLSPTARSDSLLLPQHNTPCIIMPPSPTTPLTPASRTFRRTPMSLRAAPSFCSLLLP
jgi:hypothetical protein